MPIVKKKVTDPPPDATTQTQAALPGEAAQAAVVPAPQPTPVASNARKESIRAHRGNNSASAATNGGHSGSTASKRAKLSEALPSASKPLVSLTSGNYSVLDEKQFEEMLQTSYGFEIHRVDGDGNCLFRSVADQIYGDDSMHDEIRRLCMNYMEQEKDYFMQFVFDESIEDYIARKRRLTTFGNHLELQALSELYNRPIEIYAYQMDPLNLFQTEYDKNNPPIRLSYHNQNHYNSVRDPKNPSFGVGLGLPGFEPGMADRSQVQRAIQESESKGLEAAMVDHSAQESINDQLLKTEIKSSELEFAEKQIEDAIMKQSMQDFMDSEDEEAITREIMAASMRDYVNSFRSSK